MQYRPSIIIIGNGFDLAHGLKTSYDEYITNLITQCENGKSHLVTCDDFKEISSPEISFQGLMFPSGFHASLFLTHLFGSMKSRLTSNWCDIEQDYFDQINEDINNWPHRIKEINKGFNEVKKDLEDYLANEEKRQIKPVEQYRTFFQKLSGNCLVINFNYTDTPERLYGGGLNGNIQYIQIHGKLHDVDNPIIFGYAADDSQTNKLLDKNDNEYLKNIKRFAYKRTNNETKIEKFLNNNSNNSVDCYILGHSCGLSDKLILSTILNHRSIHNINIFYFNDFEEGYYNSEINIQRITRSDDTLSKIVAYPSSLRMPQYNDNLHK